MKGGRSQAAHLRGVALMALALAEALEKVVGPIGIDRDLLLAGALCHDLGKPFEYSPRNQQRWRARPHAAGWPSVRHPVYGAHVALAVGLPEAVVHAACAHPPIERANSSSRAWRPPASTTLIRASGR